MVRPRAQRAFAERLAKEMDERGAGDVLRHGVEDRGLLFRLAYFRPAHTLADDALVQDEENRLSVTRQLRYSTKEPDRSLDLVLFVNGIPVATAELKNPLTGQTVEHAKEQYRRDRDPRELLFARRAQVHFAVDPELVFITTRLAGKATRFLPFNTGSDGPGVDGGAGNPPAGASATGRRTCGSESGSARPGSTPDDTSLAVRGVVKVSRVAPQFAAMSDYAGAARLQHHLAHRHRCSHPKMGSPRGQYRKISRGGAGVGAPTVLAGRKHRPE